METVGYKGSSSIPRNSGQRQDFYPINRLVENCSCHISLVSSKYEGRDIPYLNNCFIKELRRSTCIILFITTGNRYVLTWRRIRVNLSSIFKYNMRKRAFTYFNPMFPEIFSGQNTRKVEEYDNVPIICEKQRHEIVQIHLELKKLQHGPSTFATCDLYSLQRALGRI